MLRRQVYFTLVLLLFFSRLEVGEATLTYFFPRLQDYWSQLWTSPTEIPPLRLPSGEELRGVKVPMWKVSENGETLRLLPSTRTLYFPPESTGRFLWPDQSVITNPTTKPTKPTTPFTNIPLANNQRLMEKYELPQYKPPNVMQLIPVKPLPVLYSGSQRPPTSQSNQEIPNTTAHKIPATTKPLGNQQKIDAIVPLPYLNKLTVENMTVYAYKSQDVLLPMYVGPVKINNELYVLPILYKDNPSNIVPMKSIAQPLKNPSPASQQMIETVDRTEDWVPIISLSNSNLEPIPQSSSAVPTYANPLYPLPNPNYANENKIPLPYLYGATVNSQLSAPTQDKKPDCSTTTTSAEDTEILTLPTSGTQDIASEDTFIQTSGSVPLLSTTPTVSTSILSTTFRPTASLTTKPTSILSTMFRPTASVTTKSTLTSPVSINSTEQSETEEIEMNK